MTALVLQGSASCLPLPDGSVDCIVTSPPYFQQRDYQSGGLSLPGQIGAEATPREYVAALLKCTREWARVLRPGGSMFINLGDKYSTYTGARWGHGRNIGGGDRGTEKVPHGGPVRGPDLYGIANKSLIGLPWRYALACTGGGALLEDADLVKLLLRDVALGVTTLAAAERAVDDLAAMPDPGLGLILRAEIIWSKTNGMPESVTDRIRLSHERIFHFVKQRNYYSAIDEIRVPHMMRPQRRPDGHRSRRPPGVLPVQTWSTSQRDEPGTDGHPLGRLPGSEWAIPAGDVPAQEIWAMGAAALKLPAWLGVEHFAAFPVELPRRCILGWAPPAVCTRCGEGRRPVRDVRRVPLRPGDSPGRAGLNSDGVHGRDRRAGMHVASQVQISGYACACTPYTDHPERRGTDFHAGTDRALQGMNDGNGGERYRRYMEELASPRGPVREYHFGNWQVPPATAALVLDPFCGTGTTLVVADVLGRSSIGTDLSADYCRAARWRVSDPAERARAAGAPKPAVVPPGQLSLDDMAEAEGLGT